MGDKLNLKEQGTKVLTVVVAVGVAVGVTALAAFLVNYGYQYTQNASYVTKGT